MATLDQFSTRIKVIGKNIEKNTDALVKKVALVADQTVVLSTPVDTGRARSNWIVTVGAGSTETREPYAPGSGLGRGESDNASGAIAQGRSAVAGRKSGQDIFISNNLPYISSLNRGTSAQAPASFVEKAVQAAVAAVQQARVVK